MWTDSLNPGVTVSLCSPLQWQVIHSCVGSPSVSCGILDIACLHTSVSSLMHNGAFLHIILTLLIHHYNSSWAPPRFAARRFNQHQCQQRDSSWLIVKVSACVCVCVGTRLCVGGRPRGRVCKCSCKTAECLCLTESLAPGENEKTGRIMTDL